MDKSMEECVLMVSFHREIPFTDNDLIVFKQLAEQMNCNAVKAYKTNLKNIKIIDSSKSNNG